MVDRSSGPHMLATQRLMLRGMGIFVALVAVGAAITMGPNRATADHEAAPYTGTAATEEFTRLRGSLEATSGELEITQIALRRAQAILDYSAQYDIPADLASLIYDEALRAGLDPDLAFRIVRIESSFNPNARSKVGAIGLTQVMPATAAYYDPSLTEDDLYDPATNLRIGLRFFRDLYTRYDEDLRLALLAYNRGPTRVRELLQQGVDPRNGYASSVTNGYRARGPALP